MCAAWNTETVDPLSELQQEILRFMRTAGLSRSKRREVKKEFPATSPAAMDANKNTDRIGN
jgi:hypothetical protein